MSDLARTIEALLFLSPQPVSRRRPGRGDRGDRGPGREAIELLREDLAEGRRGVVLREVAGGFALASDPASEEAARRLLAKPRTPPLTQAQAETLAIVAYLQPVSRPEVARIRGVSSESAVQTLAERGLIEESGRSRSAPRSSRRPSCSSGSSASPGSTSCPTRRGSTRRPRTSASCASGCSRPGNSAA